MPLADPEARKAYDKSRRAIRLASPAYLAFKEQKKLTYQDRKARQVCVDCEAQLEDDDGLRCKRCDGANKDAQAIYRRTRRGRSKQRRIQKRYYRQRRKRDCCVQCGLPRKEWPKRIYLKKPSRPTKKKRGPMHCPTCRTKANEAQKRFRLRRKLGITSIRAERSKRDREMLRELRGQAYVPLDELRQKKRVAILRGLRYRGWIDPEDLFDIIGVPVHDDEDAPTERASFTKRLSHIVKTTNLIERRAIGAEYEYRLTSSGAAELDRILGAKAA
jgi:hypothetical protein